MERVIIQPANRLTLRDSIKSRLNINLKGALALTPEYFATKIPDIVPCFDVTLKHIKGNKHKLLLSTSDVNINYTLTIEQKQNSNYIKITDVE